MINKMIGRIKKSEMKRLGDMAGIQGNLDEMEQSTIHRAIDQRK